MKRPRVRDAAAPYRSARPKRAPRLDRAAPPERARRRRAVNLSLDAALIDEARAAGLNLSRTVEALLADEMKRRRWAAWQAANKDAIEAYNRLVERHGIAGEEFRPF